MYTECFFLYFVTNIIVLLKKTGFSVTIIVTFYGRIDGMGFQYINDEQKIRIPLSRHACAIINEDMRSFSVKKQSTFINTVIEGFYDTAKSSLNTYLSRKKLELEELLSDLTLSASDVSIIVSHMIAKEKASTILILSEYLKEKYSTKLYHINDSNFDYLKYRCNEEDFYNQKPGAYIKCLMEEYASLPFIKRERIFRKDVYEIVEYACNMQQLLQVKVELYGKPQVFYVYPYKILPDPLNTQEYLACYTRKPGDSAAKKVDASFSMARLEKPTILKQSAFLSKTDISKIEEDLSRLSVSYLLGEIEEIRVKLSAAGKKAYQTRLHSRPDKDTALSTENEYVFFCSQQQAYNYFFSFGPEAEIISPTSLRNKMKQNYSLSYNNYK